ncbi:MAG: branched-chain amino acid ABC transporter permease [Proteobacteria bacterium]|nr:branched-chain amino acid ABC transporter permease [Pseudomonadota bacterium]MDA1011582.1 branched-chain amino acid ABC transporter permease [Pseudomonadota bacterium]
MNTIFKNALLIATLMMLILLPVFGERFYIQFASKILIMIIFVSSLNLLVGFTGLVSLGHAAFFGSSGYVIALLSSIGTSMNLFVALLSSVLCVGALGAVFGALVLRTKGIFFIMSTLALGEMLFYFLHDTAFAGGSDGIYIHDRPGFNLFGWWQLDLSNVSHFYYLALILVCLVLMLIKRIMNSPFGRVISGIRVNEHRTKALGYHTYKFKLVCFVIASMIAAISGFLAAVQFGVVNPEMVGWHASGHALMMVILGGKGSILGPVLGTTTLMLVEEIFQVATKHWQLLTGIVVVLVALFFPNGLAGLNFPKKRPET